MALKTCEQISVALWCPYCGYNLNGLIEPLGAVREDDRLIVRCSSCVRRFEVSDDLVREQVQGRALELLGEA